MGERAISPFGIIMTAILYGWYGWWGGAISGLFSTIFNTQREQSVILYEGLITLFIFFVCPLFWAIIYVFHMGKRHFKIILKKAKKLQVGYSYNRGEGQYFEHLKGQKKWGFKIDDQFIRMVIEPLAAFRFGLVIFIVFLIGYILLIIYDWPIYFRAYISWTALTGFAIIVSSICLFLEEFGIMMKIRAAVLDVVDAEHDVKFLSREKEKITAANTNTGTFNDYQGDQDIVIVSDN